MTSSLMGLMGISSNALPSNITGNTGIGGALNTLSGAAGSVNPLLSFAGKGGFIGKSSTDKINSKLGIDKLFQGTTAAADSTSVSINDWKNLSGQQLATLAQKSPKDAARIAAAAFAMSKGKGVTAALPWYYRWYFLVPAGIAVFALVRFVVRKIFKGGNPSTWKKSGKKSWR